MKKILKSPPVFLLSSGSWVWCLKSPFTNRNFLNLRFLRLLKKFHRFHFGFLCRQFQHLRYQLSNFVSLAVFDCGLNFLLCSIRWRKHLSPFPMLIWLKQFQNFIFHLLISPCEETRWRGWVFDSWTWCHRKWTYGPSGPRPYWVCMLKHLGINRYYQIVSNLQESHTVLLGSNWSHKMIQKVVLALSEVRIEVLAIAMSERLGHLPNAVQGAPLHSA